MPHLLSLNSYHYRRGGSDVVYLDHAELMEQNGWKNTFFSMHHPKNLSTPDASDFARTVDYEYVGGPFDKVRTAAMSIYNWEAKARAKDLVRKHKFDVAHVHCIYHHLTPSVFPVLAEAGVPIVLTAHDLKVVCPAYKMMNSNGVCEDCKGGDYTHVVRNRCIKGSIGASAVVMAEAMLHRAIGSYKKYVSRIVAPSQFYRDKIIEWGFPAERVEYVPNFTRKIDDRFNSGYEGNILFFGRLSEEKGLGTLIEASRKSGVAVDIAGTGPLESVLKEQAKGSPVNFLGRLDGDRLWETVGKARAIVLPSEWYENAPMSVLEAYQLERPLIGANIGGIPELVNTRFGPAGLLFESGTVSSLADCLDFVNDLSFEGLKSYGAFGKRIVESDFSKAVYLTRMQKIYRAFDASRVGSI